jgi:hypothetical protein
MMLYFYMNFALADGVKLTVHLQSLRGAVPPLIHTSSWLGG